MPNDRCFRINEFDVDELRSQERGEHLIDGFSNWVRKYAARVDEVVMQIEEAFANTTLGNGIGLFEAKGLDDYASHEERKQIRETDEKIDWRRIPSDHLARCHSSPSFFDAEGFVFHLPAFLIAELNDKHPYGFIDRLYRTQEHPQGWRQCLTADQRRALIAMLELIREHPNYMHETAEIDSCLEDLNDAQSLQ
ncbi:DUF6714 family protein [Rhodopirellula bahusiensis]|uniref:Uncharacterized protein n=1 Tax=Rhodopirellula bahusiensis TaxID=2014065 RepID=A0A2G1VXH4_9BACT|nr:DUF6714 family protein [Rhodopirellula bahusiensis]PHQ31431.1 hypothetical protein CEE69_31215 [Rhodopirellula bahusiensis]